MVPKTRFVAALSVVLIVGGCSLAEEGLWPSLIGDEPASPASATQVRQIPPSSGELAGSPLIEPMAEPTAPVPGGPTAVPLDTRPTATGPATGTFVGGKVGSLHGELEGLKRVISGQNNEFQQVLNSTTQNSQRYHAVIAAINARLQVGTTPGNPVLVSQWQTAQTELDRVVQDASRLNELSNRISANSALANYLVESTRAAYSIQGAVDEDHRQLAILEDDVDRTAVSIDRLLNEVNESIARQNSYVAGERRNLTSMALAISHGEAFGPNLAAFATSPSARLSVGAAPVPMSAYSRGPAYALAAADLRPPLVIIRFDRPDVQYQQPLYSAVSKALERRPAASFDLIAITPNRGSPSQVASASTASKKNAQRVLKSLLAMGLPANRINLNSATADSATGNEVHIYIR